MSILVLKRGLKRFAALSAFLVSTALALAAARIEPTAVPAPAKPAAAVKLAQAAAPVSPTPAVSPASTAASTSTAAPASTPATAAGPASPAATAVPAAPAAGSGPTLLSRGAYLARLGDCSGCHTAPGGKPYAGGLPINTPMGKIYPTNITPDRDTGIGRYAYIDFQHALRAGIGTEGWHLYPAMPYASFAALTDDDVHALYDYFMHEVQAVAHTTPPTKLPFPFNQRWGLTFWNTMFKTQKVFTPDPSQDTVWNRGAYLVRSLGHCGACHTPRGFAYEERGYSEKNPLFLSGGVQDHWYAPNLRGDPDTGLGRWSVDDIAAFLGTGHGAGVMAFGPMIDVIQDSTQYFSAADLHAVAIYLKSLPPVGKAASYTAAGTSVAPGAAPVRLAQTIEAPGAGLYQNFCAKCHLADGAGKPGKYPRLTANPLVLAEDVSSIIRIVLAGGSTAKTQAGIPVEKMPAFASKLTDRQIADVLSYVRASWGNHAAPVSPGSVKALRPKKQ